MEVKQMLNSLIEIGTNMRAAQKGFFAAKDKEERKNFLIKSKQHEGEFDNALFNIKQLLK
jgi:hypothetical protein